MEQGKKIYEVGLTGGIGSGKSTAARIFSSFGYKVYLADDRAKALYVENQVVKNAIINLLGPHAYLESGKPDKAFIASKIFNDNDLLKRVNSIIHPATKEDYELWLKSLESDYTKGFILKEAAILFEAGTWKYMDAVISVYAPKSVRMKRVMSRDNANEQEILARMDKQMPESFKMQNADFVIYNDGEHHLIDQVGKCIEFLREKFGIEN